LVALSREYLALIQQPVWTAICRHLVQAFLGGMQCAGEDLDEKAGINQAGHVAASECIKWV
jgi:hypothetical protein